MLEQRGDALTVFGSVLSAVLDFDSNHALPAPEDEIDLAAAWCGPITERPFGAGVVQVTPELVQFGPGPVGWQPISDQGVNQDMEVASSRLARNRCITGDIRHICRLARRKRRSLEKAAEAAEIAHECFGSNLLVQIYRHICA